MATRGDMTIDIRPLAATHHADWLPLWHGYQAFYEVDIPAPVSAVTWSRLLDPREPMNGALAWDDGEAIGLVHTIRHRSCWTTGDYAYLQDLYVAEGRRAGGVGRRLIAHAEAQARIEGCSRLYWLTHETNGNAMKLYDQIADRSGFIQYRKLFAPLC